MRELTHFDPSNTLGDSFDTSFGTQASESQLYVWNDSNAALSFQLAPGKNILIPPGVGYPILKRNYPMSRIYWTQEYLLSGTAIASRTTVEYYEPGEPLPSQTPIPIIRNVNVGNTVNTGATVGTANQVDYDQTAINGETAGSVTSTAAAGGAAPLVDVTESNPTGGKWKFAMKTGEFDIGSDGSATAPAFHGVVDNATNVGDGANSARLTVGDTGTNLDIKPTSGAARGLTLNTRDSLGTLHQIASAANDGTGAVFHGTADSATSVPQIDTTHAGSGTIPQVKAAANTGLSTLETTGAGGRKLVALVPTEGDSTVRGIGLGYTDAAGTFHLLLQSDDNNALTYAPTNAHFRATSFFSGTGPGTFNHNFPGTPSWIGITPTEPGSSQTVGIDSITSTTVHVNMPNNWPWIGVAMG